MNKIAHPLLNTGQDVEKELSLGLEVLAE